MDAFLLSKENVAGYELKPWNMTTQKAIKFLEDKDLTNDQQALAIVYVQSQPAMKIVEEIARKTLLESIEAFSAEFPLAGIPAVVAWCKRQSDLIDSAQVEVVPRCDRDPNEPPNS